MTLVTGALGITTVKQTTPTPIAAAHIIPNAQRHNNRKPRFIISDGAKPPNNPLNRRFDA
jgi:hypothetical protein